MGQGEESQLHSIIVDVYPWHDIEYIDLNDSHDSSIDICKLLKMSVDFQALYIMCLPSQSHYSKSRFLEPERYGLLFLHPPHLIFCSGIAFTENPIVIYYDSGIAAWIYWRARAALVMSSRWPKIRIYSRLKFSIFGHFLPWLYRKYSIYGLL